MFKSQSHLILNKRPGFTLVELLIAIAIITVLVSLSAGGVFKFLSYQKQAATAKTVDQLNMAIERVLKNIRAKVHLEYPSTPIRSILTKIGTNLQSSNLIGTKEPTRMGELVFSDLEIARAFPLLFNSINAANPITVSFTQTSVFPGNTVKINNYFNSEIPTTPGLLLSYLNVIPSIVNAKKSISKIPPNPSTEIQNSACLLMALEANPDGLKGESLGSAVTFDSDSGARYIVTGDGQPITFQLRYLDVSSSSSASLVGTVTVEIVVP